MAVSMKVAGIDGQESIDPALACRQPHGGEERQDGRMVL
jgi:hypothetical protein